MRVRLPSLLLIFAAGFLLLAGSLSAQTISGIIAGRVLGPDGKPLANVGITAQNPNTGRGFSASTNDQGFYRLLEVPPGVYKVDATLAGFDNIEHTEVRVDVNRTTVEDFAMRIKTQAETISVKSTAPMAAMDSPTLNSAMTEVQVIGLPVLTRDVNNLALLAPGVESVRTFSFASTLVPFSVNGSRGRDNNFTIDSVDNNEPLFGGAASQFTNSEIFQEYSISTGLLKAEFGRNSGATINAITKSGSNNWHGTLFAFGQDDMFDAMNQVEKQALLTSPEPFYDTTLGLTLGGPIKKEKAFFFLSYQWDRVADNLSDVFPVLSNYPASPADLAAIQALPTNPGLTAYLGTPSVTRIPSLGNVTPCFAQTPANGLYRRPNPCLVTSTPVPIVNGEFGFAPGPNQSSCAPSTATIAYSCFNVWNVPNANTFNLRDHQLSGRYDQILNDSNTIYARYLFDDLSSPIYPLNSASTAAFSDIGELPDWKIFNRNRTQSLLFDHRYQRVSSLNEFRLSYSRVSQGQGAFNAPVNSLDRPAAIISDCFSSSGTSNPFCTTPNTLAPLGGEGGLFQSAGNLTTLGTDSSPTHNTSNTYQLQDNYSYTYKRHSLKFGVNFAKIDTNSLGLPDDNGFYLYGGFFGIDGFESFLTEGDLSPTTSNADIVSRRLVDVRTNTQGLITGFGPNEIKIKEFDQFYFAQDDWRARDNLTFSFGLRYENYGQPINSVHDINPAAPFVNTDNKDFAPRLGFAYSPSQHWVVRGGYTISYDPPILDIPLLIWQSGPVSPLISTDIFGIAQLQPSTIYPARPLTVADVNHTFPFPEATITNGAVNLININTGMVQGCSRFDDLYNIDGPQVTNPATGKPYPTSSVPIGSRVYSPFAGVNPVTGAGVTLPNDVPIQNCSDQNTVAKNLKNPYYQSWSLGTQYELGSNYLLEVDYVGGKGTRLFQRIDQNPYQGWDLDCLANIKSLYAQAVTNFPQLAIPGQCRLPRVDNTHGDILQINNGGSSTYNALQASLTKRLSTSKYYGKLALTTAYTWSHLIDNTSEIFGPGFRTISNQDFAGFTATASSGLNGLGALFDPLASAPVEAITPLSEIYNQTTAAERGSSSFDRRQRLASSFLWDPFPKENIKNVFLNGWEINGVFSFQSGQPFSPLNSAPESVCADATGAGFVGSVRPLIGNPNAPTSSVALINLATDPLCLPPGAIQTNGVPVPALTYMDANGNPIDPKTAHFVQVPLGVISPIGNVAGGKLAPVTLSTSNGTETFTAAGRNILVGPRTTDLDMAVYRSFKLTERYTLQFRVEVYDLLNHPNLGYFNGSPYIANAVSSSAFAYSDQRTAASITGGIPENAIDAFDAVCSPAPAVCPATGRKTNNTFLSTSTMNTGNRRMQFGVRFIF